MKQVLFNRRGFTLLEILTVLALTLIIMGLVFGPLVKSFDFTRQAEVMIRTQDNARFALSQVSRDLGNAMYVYDNYNMYYYRSTVRDGEDPFTADELRDTVRFPMVDKTGNPVDYYFLYAKVDMVLPLMRGYCPKDAAHTPGGENLSTPGSNLDESEPRCPVCGTKLEVKPVQPLTPGNKIVRYFIGLRDPGQYYANGFENRLTQTDNDNMFVLYRVEFDPMDDNLFPPLQSGQTIRDRIADPDFFYRQPYVNEWKRIARPIVSMNDTDLIRFERDRITGRVKYDSTGLPFFSPTVTFAPTAIFNDPLKPTSDVENDPEHQNAPATMYKATYGYWVLPYEVIVEPEGRPGYSFYTHTGFGATSFDLPSEMCVYRGAVGDPSSELVFNITRYEQTRAQNPFGVGDVVPSGVSGEQRAFKVDTVRGAINFSFPVSTVNRDGMAVSMSTTTEAIENNAQTNGYRRVIIDPQTDSVISNSSVVPSSVKVIAPDTRPSSFGAPALYTRVPLFADLIDPRPNLFSVDPYFQVDPVTEEAKTAINFYSTHTPGHDLGPQMPEGEVLIYYEVQNNKQGDTIKANYTTKSLLTVTMGIRMYTPNGRAEMVELVNKVKLKNIKT